MTTITDDLPARLLHEEHAAWQAVCSGRGGDYFAREMTADGVMIVPGAIVDRAGIREGFAGPAPWDSYEIHDPRVIRLGDLGGVLVYRAVATTAGERVEIYISTTYIMDDGGWRVAALQQTPV